MYGCTPLRCPNPSSPLNADGSGSWSCPSPLNPLNRGDKLGRNRTVMFCLPYGGMVPSSGSACARSHAEIFKRDTASRKFRLDRVNISSHRVLSQLLWTERSTSFREMHHFLFCSEGPSSLENLNISPPKKISLITQCEYGKAPARQLHSNTHSCLWSGHTRKQSITHWRCHP